jgi:hypothetical protein
VGVLGKGEMGDGHVEGFTCTRRMSAPASASARDMACPIPRVPPVTRAVWPSREKSCCTDVIVSCWVTEWCGVKVRNALEMYVGDFRYLPDGD